MLKQGIWFSNNAPTDFFARRRRHIAPSFRAGLRFQRNFEGVLTSLQNARFITMLKREGKPVKTGWKSVTGLRPRPKGTGLCAAFGGAELIANIPTADLQHKPPQGSEREAVGETAVVVVVV